MRETSRITCGQGFVLVCAIEIVSKYQVFETLMNKAWPKLKTSTGGDGELTIVLFQWPVSLDQLLDDRNILS